MTPDFFRNCWLTCFGILILGGAASVSAVEPAQRQWKYAPELLRPFWMGDTVEGESVLFIRDLETGEARASVLFPIQNVLRVGNSAGDVTYEEGRDYLWKPESREIRLPSNSRIISRTPDELRRPAGSQKYKLTHRDGNGEIFFGGQLEYHDMQTCITYTHAPEDWKAIVPTFDEQALPRTINKLRRQQPVSIVLIGDSISAGCNASGWAGEAPFQPSFPGLLQQHLSAHWKTRVRVTNPSVSGKDTRWVLSAVDKVVEPKPDLVIVAFGMNDAAGRSADEYQANTKAVMAKIRERLPAVEFILVASMLGNRNWTRLQHELFPQYRNALANLCQPGVALADLTSIWTEFLKRKQDWDLTGNGVNHPNDFGHRVYAQVLSTLLIPTSVAVARADSSRPNIVFMLADDLGWADVAFHGGNAPTPSLDQLARLGLELTQHYVAPVCSPTRAGFLTGRCWSRFGITTPTNALALPRETVTLATALGSRGYETCLVGKWHLGSKPEWGPNHFGFDHSYGSLAGGVTAWSHRYKTGQFSFTWHRNEELLEEEGHVTDLLADEAVRWIAARGEQPFFLYVPFTAVHLPINEPQPWLDKVPQTITSDIGRHYAACVMHLDAAVGRILKALHDKGVRERTLVVFTSDNGGSTTTNNTQPYPRDDSPSGRLTANNGSLRGQKGSVYEGGTRVPTLVSWPGKISPRQESTPVFIADWMPTLCQLAGHRTDTDLRWDGVNLSALLFNEEPLPERPIYIAGPRGRAVSLRMGDWKLVVRERAKNELFHITEDPSEASNLADKAPDRLEQMLATLEEVRVNDNDQVVK